MFFTSTFLKTEDCRQGRGVNLYSDNVA